MDDEKLLKKLGIPLGLSPDELERELQAKFNVTNGDPVGLEDVISGSAAIGAALPKDEEDEPWSSSFARRFCRKAGWPLKINKEWWTLQNSAEAYSENLPSKEERNLTARRANQPKAVAARAKRLKEGTLFEVHTNKTKPR